MHMKSAVFKNALVGVLTIGLCVLSGCFQWTEDSQGSLKSAGLPGLPIWQSKAPPAPVKPTDLGFTPEQASKLGGEVLVMPTANSQAMRYQFYQVGENHCEGDLKKMLADRAQQNATDPPPYCTENPTQPTMKGNAFVF